MNMFPMYYLYYKFNVMFEYMVGRQSISEGKESSISSYTKSDKLQAFPKFIFNEKPNLFKHENILSNEIRSHFNQRDTRLNKSFFKRRDLSQYYSI